MAVIGYSKGARLAFDLANLHPELQALVLMGPGPGIVDESLPKAASLPDPVLIQVAENDVYEPQGNMFEASLDLFEGLQAMGKNVTRTVYPPYQDNGHRMFWVLGDYWFEVETFLNAHL
jgi:dienelactone hydrolase